MVDFQLINDLRRNPYLKEISQIFFVYINV